MNQKRKPQQGECAYCGEWREITRDHIPSRSLFSKPRPSDLITVPSCLPCNKGISKDDEYFNIVVKIGIDPNRFPSQNADSLDTIYNLARPKSLGFARFFLQGYQPNPSRLIIDHDRVGIVLRRVVRGLFYRDTGMRLPEFVPFQVVSLCDQPKRAAALKDVIDMLTTVYFDTRSFNALHRILL